MKLFTSYFKVAIVVLCLGVFVQGVPLFTDDNSNHVEGPPSSAPANGGRRVSIQSVVGRNNRARADGDLDPQTKNDLRILSLFEHELNKIFSCYVRLSCPRTRSPKVISECEEIREWPLYHQVMRMAGIKRYPYQHYAPSVASSGGSSSVPAAIFGVSANRRTEDGHSQIDNEIQTEDEGAAKSRRYHRRQRRNQQIAQNHE